MGWHNQIETILLKHLTAPAAEVALTLFSAFYTVEQITLSGVVNDETKGGMVRMLVGLTFGLPANPWFQKNHHMIMPVFGVAVNGWLDACQYTAEGKASEAKAITTRAMIMEVASAVLLADKGIADARKVSKQLRDELAAVKLE